MYTHLSPQSPSTFHRFLYFAPLSTIWTLGTGYDLLSRRSRVRLGSQLDKDGNPRGVLPIMAYTGRLRPKGVPFSGFRYILLVEVYERVGKSVIWVCERTQRANRKFLWLYKVEKTFYFCHWFPVKRLHLQQLKELQSSKRGMWKGVGWVEYVHKWTESGCRWRLCMLTSELPSFLHSRWAYSSKIF